MAIPVLSPVLGDAYHVVHDVLSSVLSVFGISSPSSGGVNEEQAQWNLLAAHDQAIQAIIVDMDAEAKAMHDNVDSVAAVGYDIGRVGYVQWEMWQRLRYKIMPDTIANMYTFIWRAGVDPLRVGLVNTANWATNWFVWTDQFLFDLRAWTWRIQNITRAYRAQYVYPQLLYVLSPWRFAFWNKQEITTAVVDYLRDTHHAEHRDTLSREVYGDMSRLWAVFDQKLAEWLLTDVGDFGWGSTPPKWPHKAHTPPPPLPPGVWEPWQPEPAEPRSPTLNPRIPSENYTHGW